MFIFAFASVKAQVYQLMPQYGYDAKRMNFDSTLSIPTFCGVPSIKSIYTKKGAIAFDSCNGRFYYYDPKLLTWSTITGGSTDTTSLSNRINNKVDSVKKSGDSVYFYKNGIAYFTFKDASSQTLQNVLDNSSTNKNGYIYSYDKLFIGTGNDGNSEGGKGLFITGVETDLAEIAWLGSYDSLTNTPSGFMTGNVIKGNSISSDTTTYKPLGISNSGQLVNLSSWGSPKIDSLKRSSDSVYAKKNGSWIFQYKDSIGGANGFVPYTGATQDVDLGNNKISTKSVYITGTAGNGHLHLKHQSADATATGQSTSLFANSDGDLKWKNDGNYYTTLKTQQSADRIYTFQNKSYTLGDSADIAARVKYTDTATILLPYLRKIDTSSLSSRINLKLNISDSSGMLTPYLRKIDTSSLSSRINLRVLYTDTATMLTNYMRKSDTTAMLNPYQRKYRSAYSMNVNNTNAGANSSETTYKQFASATYSGSITWTGTTAPSGTTNHTYSWNQVGKLVTIRINLIYSVAGSTLTQVACALPSDCPTPEVPSGIGAANDVISYGIGMLTTNLNTTSSATAVLFSALRVNPTATGYEIAIPRASANYRYAYATIQYFAQ